MIDLEQIIQPIAGANPCGIDLEYDSRFQAIKDLVDAGTEDSPTNWKKVQKDCVELLNDGRNVELLVLLAVSLVVTDGFVGLRDGLHILAQSVQEFWDTIYPELDMDEPESERYEIRLNTLAQLGEQPRKMGDKLCFVEHVLRAPLSPSNARGAPGFWPVWSMSRPVARMLPRRAPYRIMAAICRQKIALPCWNVLIKVFSTCAAWVPF